MRNVSVAAGVSSAAPEGIAQYLYSLTSDQVLIDTTLATIERSKQLIERVKPPYTLLAKHPNVN
jgi:hypothetical protein